VAAAVDEIPLAEEIPVAAAVDEIPLAEEIPMAAAVDEIPLAEEIPMAAAVDEIPAEAPPTAAVEAMVRAATVNDIPTVPPAEGNPPHDETPAVGSPPSPLRPPSPPPSTELSTLAAGALIADEEILQPRKELRRSRWTYEEEEGTRPSDLFPLRGRRGQQAGADAWEEARQARESQQTAAREQAMAQQADELQSLQQPAIDDVARETSEAVEAALAEGRIPAHGMESMPQETAEPPAPSSVGRVEEMVPAENSAAPPGHRPMLAPSPARQPEAPTHISGGSSDNDLVIAQVSISGEVEPRREIVFEMHFRNNTAQTIRSITLRCDMPQHTSYMPESTTFNGHPVPDERGASPISMGRGLFLGDLEPGQEGRVGFKCILNPGLRDGTLVQHTVYLLQETRAIATHTCFTRARGEAIFDREGCKISAAPAHLVAPEDVIDYTFAVRNVGSAPATGVTLIGRPPPHVSYVPNSTRWEGRVLVDVEGTSPLFSAGGLYLGTLASGEAHSASYQVRVARPLDNGAMLECGGEVRSHELETLAVAPMRHQVVAASAFAEQRLRGGCGGLNMVNLMRNDEEVRDTTPGELLMFDISVCNSGDAHAQSVRVGAEIPTHVQYVPGTVRRDGQNVPDGVDGGNVLLSEEGLLLGRVEAAMPGQEARVHHVTFQGRVSWPLPNGVEVVTSGWIAAHDVMRQPLTSVRALVHSSPRFESNHTCMAVDPVGRVRPGEILTFTIRYKNSGDAPAENVVLRAGLPAEAPYVAGSTRHDGRTLPDEDQSSVLFGEHGFHLGTVDAGANGEVSFQALVRSPLDRGTIIRSKAALTCAELPPMAFPPITLEVVSSPDFGSEKVNRLEVTPAETVRPGETLQYVLHFKNAGDANANGVVLRARIPNDATPIEGSLTLDGKSLADVGGVPAIFSAEGLRLDDVPAGRGGRVTYATTVNRPLENATQIYHAVTIACDQARPVETKAVLVMVTSAPDFSSVERNRLDVFPKGDVTPGQKLVYTLDYRNSGDADASNVFVKARLPAHTSYVPESTRVNGLPVADFRNTSALFSQRGLVIGNVPVDLGGKVTFEVRVNSPLDNGTPLECQSHIGCAEASGAVATNKVENRVVSAPDFNQEDSNYLTASPSGEIQPEETISYTVRYKNTGNARARGMVVRAEIDRNVSYRPGSTLLNGRPVPDAKNLSQIFTGAGLPIGAVDAEESGELTFQAQVHSPLDNGTTLSAQAFLVSEALGQVATNRITHSVMSLPSFSDPAFNRLEIAPAGPVRPGDRLTCMLHYKNTGRAPALAVSARGDLPQHAALVTDSLRVNGLPAPAEEFLSDSGRALGRVAAGEGGSISWMIDVQRPLPNGTAITAAAWLRDASAGTTQLTSPQLVVSSRVDFSPQAGNEIVPSAEESAPGETVMYTIRWRNAGDANAGGVSLAVQLLSSELSYVPHMTTLNGMPVPETGPVGQLLLQHGLPVGDVPAGGGGEATFTLRIGKRTADGARLGVRAEIRCDQAAPMALEAPPLGISAPPDFSDAAYNNLEAYPAGKVACDELLTYTVNYGNRGNAIATDVQLRAQLPEHTAYVPGTTFLNGEPVPDAAGSSPLFRSPGLAVGVVGPQAYGNVVFQVRVNSDLPNGTSINCTATIECGGKYAFNTTTTRNNVSSTPDFGGPDGAHLEVSPVGDVGPGDTLTYLFNYHNRGNATATHVALRTRLPEHTRYLARSTKLNGPPVQDLAGTSPLFTERGLVLPEVPSGISGRVSFRVQVDSPLASGTEIPAQMTLTGQQIAQVASNRVLTTVIAYPDFAPGEATYMQVFPQGQVAPRQVLTYVLYYQNTGTTHAEALQVSSHLPVGTTYLAGSTRANGYAVADIDGVSPLFVADGVLIRGVEAGVSGNLSFQVQVEEGAADGLAVQTRADLQTVPATSPASVTATAVTVWRGATVIAPPSMAPLSPPSPGMVIAPPSAGLRESAPVPASPVIAAPSASPAIVPQPTVPEADTPSPAASEVEIRLPLERMVSPTEPPEIVATPLPPAERRLSLDIERLRRVREERRDLEPDEAAEETREIPSVEALVDTRVRPEPAEATAKEEAHQQSDVVAEESSVAPPVIEEELPPMPVVADAKIPIAGPAMVEEEIPAAVEDEIPTAAAAVAEEGALPAAEQELPLAGAVAHTPVFEEFIPDAARVPPTAPEETSTTGDETEIFAAEPTGESDEALDSGDLPLSVYLTITRDQLEALRRLQTSQAGLLTHFEVSAQLMGRSFYGTYRADDTKTLNALMGSLSRSLSEYHRSHRTLLARLISQMEGGEALDLVAVDDPSHEEALGRIDDFVTRFYAMQEEAPLAFSPPRHDSGKKSFIVGAHMPRMEYQLVRRLIEESKGYAGFLRHLIFVQTLMGTVTAARQDRSAEDLDGLLREYGSAMKSALNRLLVNARSGKKIDLSRTNRQLERALQALVDFLHQNL